MASAVDQPSSVGMVASGDLNPGEQKADLHPGFEFPDDAVPTDNTCALCGEKALYVLPEGGMFSNKVFCASCETCLLCEENSSHHERFCSICFCDKCGWVKHPTNFLESVLADFKNVCECEMYDEFVDEALEQEEEEMRERAEMLRHDEEDFYPYEDNRDLVDDPFDPFDREPYDYDYEGGGLSDDHEDVDSVS